LTKAIPLRRILVLNACWVGLSFTWNALHPIVLPALLLGFVPSGEKNTYLGLLTFAGLVVAMLIQPASGAASDGWGSRFGRRRPLMAIGTVVSCLFLLALGWSRSLALLFVAYIGLQVGTNVVQGPLQGLLRDRVPLPQLGLASSVKILIDILCLSLAAAVAGRLMRAGARGPGDIAQFLLGIFAIFAAITICFAREEPSQGVSKAGSASIAMPLANPAGQNASYVWLIAERGVFLLGVYGLQVFGEYYLTDVLRVPDPPRQAGDLLAAMGIATLALVLAGGWLSDKFDTKRVLFLASGLTALGLVLLLATKDIHGITLSGSIVGGGIGLFLTSNWALANRMAPGSEAGKYLGLTNLATAGSAALARLEGPAVDFLNAASPQHWFGYEGIFVFGILCVVASAACLTRVQVSQ
jgi:MFS family permease